MSALGDLFGLIDQQKVRQARAHPGRCVFLAADSLARRCVLGAGPPLRSRRDLPGREMTPSATCATRRRSDRSTTCSTTIEQPASGIHATANRSVPPPTTRIRRGADAQKSGFTGVDHEWEGPVLVEVTLYKEHTQTARYRGSLDKETPFELYVPLFMLGAKAEAPPKVLGVAIDRSGRSRRTIGLFGEWRPLAAEPGVCEFAFVAKEDEVEDVPGQARQIPLQRLRSERCLR